MSSKRTPFENLPLSERFARLNPRIGAPPTPLANARARHARAILDGGRIAPSSSDPLLYVARDKLTRAYDGGVRQLGLIRQQQSADASPPPATYRPLAGAQENNRGRAIKIVVAGTNAATASQFPQVVVETPKNGGSDAESLVVTLGWTFADRTPDDAVSNATTVKATADLLWGAGGAIFSAQIDWMQGTMLTLPASYARVSLSNVTLDGTPGPDVSVNFNASYAYGYAGGARYATGARLTVPVAATLALAANTPDIAIPTFATAMNLVASPPNCLLLITFSESSASGGQSEVEIVGLNNGFNLSPQAIPIPNGARFFNVTNLGVAASAIDAIFHIF